MKQLTKIQINPERLIRNEELLTLRGGYSSYLCYARKTILGDCSGFITGINTASCQWAKDLCFDLYGGDCVTGGDCQ